MGSKNQHCQAQPRSELPAELKSAILAQPIYRQEEVKRWIPVSNSAFKHGRLGKGALSGLKFSRMGRMVVYKAGDLVEYLESLPSLQNSAAARPQPDNDDAPATEDVARAGEASLRLAATGRGGDRDRDR